jgi:hypothetical protein
VSAVHAAPVAPPVDDVAPVPFVELPAPVMPLLSLPVPVSPPHAAATTRTTPREMKCRMTKSVPN